MIALVSSVAQQDPPLIRPPSARGQVCVQVVEYGSNLLVGVYTLTAEVFTVPHVFLASPRGISRSPCGLRTD